MLPDSLSILAFKTKINMEVKFVAAVFFLVFTAKVVQTTHAECLIVIHFLEKEEECKLKQKTTDAVIPATAHNKTAGCAVEWDGVSCWPAALIGESVSVSCPPPLLKPDSPAVLITRNCTLRGWSQPSLPYFTACYLEDANEDEHTGEEQNYFATVKLIYTIGYGVSLGSLFMAILVFCIFRKLLCTRTYIHLNLFSTFILRGLAVFVKDAVLFADESMNHCTVSTVKCKSAVTFFQYCVLANFFWLLVEGLYLQTLLIFTFAQKKKLFWVYTIIGWGTPSITILIWALLKSQLDNRGCWDDLDSALWWIIKTPILFSVFVNFVVFININRIIIQKTKATKSNGTEQPPYKRLARSTLLLIPLFGVHYVLFALFPEHVGVGPRLYLELVLGSFQGFIVALLYCFLNAEVRHEVQKEIQKVMKACWSQEENNLATQDYVA